MDLLRMVAREAYDCGARQKFVELSTITSEQKETPVG
jgi:hypothetical protein